jgi:hypothetical protein
MLAQHSYIPTDLFAITISVSCYLERLTGGQDAHLVPIGGFAANEHILVQMNEFLLITKNCPKFP